MSKLSFKVACWRKNWRVFWPAAVPYYLQLLEISEQLLLFLSYCKYRPQSSIFAAVWFWEGFFGFVFVFTELIGHRLFQLVIISFLLRDTSFSELNLLNLFQCKAKPIRSLHPKVKGWDLLHTSLCSQNQWDPEGLLCWLIFFFIKQAMVSDRWSVGIQCVVHELLCLAKEGM